MNETIKWIDETERPDVDFLVLLARTGHDICIGYFDDGDGGDQWRADNGAVIDQVTHWAEMPIGPL